MSRGVVEQVLVDDAAIRDIARSNKVSQFCLTEFSQIALVACAAVVSCLCWAMVFSVIL